MTRNHAREIAVHLSFAHTFSDQSADEFLEQSLSRGAFDRLKTEETLYEEYPNEKQRRYIGALVKGVYDHGAELDSYISRYAIGWAFSRISRVSAAIMRVAMYEVLYMPDVPAAAAINSAVELAKHYEAPEAAAFINGILGAFVRGELPPERAASPAENAEKAGEDEQEGGE